jgi:hypothetical protein
MTQTSSFTDRIRKRYPEGLTGVFVMGGTRLTYALTHGHGSADPGHINEFDDYTDYGYDLLRNIFSTYFELGGQNIIYPGLSYQQFNNSRGSEYTEHMVRACYKLMQDQWVDFYHQMKIDPYITGIDTLIHFPESQLAYDFGMKCRQFNESWSYKAGRRKLIWEIAPIPLFSFWRAHQVMGKETQADLEHQISTVPDLQTLHDSLYQYYSRAVYGVELPKPHFYLGTNRNGDLKLRAMLPIALLCGDPFRMFFVPYPSLFTTRETLQAILEDLAFGNPLRSTKADYSGQLTSELVEQEYQRILKLSADPTTTLGFVRKVQSDNQD